MSNLATGCAEYLADERRQASLDGFFSQFSADVRNGIEAVAMDMWDPRPPDPYITSTRQHLADADDKIVFDRYRLIAHLTKAVDTVRKQENRALGAKGDKRYFWATHFRLQPVIDAAKSLKRHEAGLLSYFAHRLTNAGAEGINSRIQAIRVAGRGYRNRKNFKTAIWFHLGDLQLYPIAP